MVMACGWWIHDIVVTDKKVDFYIGVVGNSWSISLKNVAGIVEAGTSGSSYGNHSLMATTYGHHILELNCSWKSSSQNPCEICDVDIPVTICADVSVSMVVDIT